MSQNYSFWKKRKRYETNKSHGKPYGLYFCGVQSTQIVESQRITVPLQNAHLHEYLFHVNSERHEAKPTRNRDMVHFVPDGVPRLKAIGPIFPPARSSPI